MLASNMLLEVKIAREKVSCMILWFYKTVLAGFDQARGSRGTKANTAALHLEEYSVSLRSLHHASIFRLLLKIAVWWLHSMRL